jgi:hypothetical protein
MPAGRYILPGVSWADVSTEAAMDVDASGSPISPTVSQDAQGEDTVDSLAVAAARLQVTATPAVVAAEAEAARAKARAKAKPPGVPDVPFVPQGALAGYDVAKLVVLTGYGSPVVDLEAIKALAPSDPRVALLAARRLLFNLDRSANPNDVYTSLHQLPASLSTFLGVSREWVEIAGKAEVQLSMYEAVANGRPKQRTLFGHGDQSFYMGDPLGGVGFPGHYRSFLTYFLRILIAVYEPSAMKEYNSEASPDAHGFDWVFGKFRELWT